MDNFPNKQNFVVDAVQSEEIVDVMFDEFDLDHEDVIDIEDMDIDRITCCYDFIEDGYRGNVAYWGIVQIDGTDWYTADYVSEGIYTKINHFDLDKFKSQVKHLPTT